MGKVLEKLLELQSYIIAERGPNCLDNFLISGVSVNLPTRMVFAPPVKRASSCVLHGQLRLFACLHRKRASHGNFWKLFSSAGTSCGGYCKGEHKLYCPSAHITWHRHAPFHPREMIEPGCILTSSLAPHMLILTQTEWCRGRAPMLMRALILELKRLRLSCQGLGQL